MECLHVLSLSLWVRLNLGVMTVKEYSTFPKAQGWELFHQMQFNVILKTLTGGFLPTAEMQSASSTVPANWADKYAHAHPCNLYY